MREKLLVVWVKTESFHLQLLTRCSNQEKELRWTITISLELIFHRSWYQISSLKLRQIVHSLLLITIHRLLQLLKIQLILHTMVHYHRFLVHQTRPNNVSTARNGNHPIQLIFIRETVLIKTRRMKKSRLNMPLLLSFQPARTPFFRQ